MNDVGTKKLIGRIGQSLPFVLVAGLIAGPAGAADGKQVFPFSYVTQARAAPPPAAAPDAGGTKIVRGEVAAEGAWPWQVALIKASEADPFLGQFCGGSFVTNQWILTAAHCVFDEKEDGTAAQVAPGDIRVLAGTNNLQIGSGEVIEVAEIHAHPDYDPVAIDNDVALIKLARPPQSAIKTVKVPTREAEDTLAASGTQVVVTGWGKMEDNKFPVELREVRIQLLPREECNQAVLETKATEAAPLFLEAADALGVADDVADQAWQQLIAGTPVPINENMVCSGTYGDAKGSCNGDSGGPLVVALQDGSYLQVGIVSWGFTSAEDSSTCDTNANFSAYTRVANYLDWMSGIVSGR